MENWSIVAIPKKDDYIWSISSEKIPHLTLMDLGDQPDNTPNVDIVGFLQYVVELTLPIFGLSVDYRGTLGPKAADVLFFEKWGIDKLEQFRGYLLTNQDISRMYNSTEQYDKFTPHVTLGFPETPAKKDDRDHPGIYYVDFDRVALWTGDYDGPEFRLGRNDSLSEIAAMSDIKVSELSHFGVKGMKWGVRRSSSQLARRSEDSEEHTTSRKMASNPKRTLSNDELQTVITRKNLEKQFSNLNPSVVKKGHNALKGVLAVAGTVSTIIALQNSPVGKAVKGKIKG